MIKIAHRVNMSNDLGADVILRDPYLKVGFSAALSQKVTG